MASSNEENKDTTTIAERPILQTNVVGAFIAGVALANFNKNLLLGFVIGTLAGAYAQQTLPGQFPNVKEFWYDLKRKWKENTTKK